MVKPRRGYLYSIINRGNRKSRNFFPDPGVTDVGPELLVPYCAEPLCLSGTADRDQRPSLLILVPRLRESTQSRMHGELYYIYPRKDNL
jgi:hypothetical protein